MFIATEPGLKFLSTRSVRVSSWTRFLDVLDELETGKHNFGCIVVDTVDNLYDFCFKYVAKRDNFKDPADVDWGKGWRAIRDEWFDGITRLVAFDKGIIFIGHATEKEVKEGGMKVDKTMPALQKTGYASINALVDYILAIKIEKKKVRKGGRIKTIERRVIRTKPNAEIEAGDRGGDLPEVIPFSFEDFVEAFENRKVK